MTPSEIETELRLRLHSALFWLTQICDAADIDPETTLATVSIKGGNNPRDVAKVKLADTLADIRTTLAK